MLLGAGVVAAGILVAVRHGHAPTRLSENDRVAAMARVVIEALKTGRLQEALAVCAEGPQARAAIEEDNRRIFNTPGDQPGAGPGDPAVRPASALEFLTRAREDMARQGVEWEQARALAFGGVQAKVFDPGTMREPATAITGEIYFACGDAVYAIELTARSCDAGIIVTDFWKWTVTGAAPEKVEPDSWDRFQAFRQEPPKADESAQIQRPRHLFVPLEGNPG